MNSASFVLLKLAASRRRDAVEWRSSEREIICRRSIVLPSSHSCRSSRRRGIETLVATNGRARHELDTRRPLLQDCRKPCAIYLTPGKSLGGSVAFP